MRKLLSIFIATVLIVAMTATSLAAYAAGFSVLEAITFDEIVMELTETINAFNQMHGGVGELQVVLEHLDEPYGAPSVLIAGEVTGATRGLVLPSIFSHIRWQARLSGDPGTAPLVSSSSFEGGHSSLTVIDGGEIISTYRALEIASVTVWGGFVSAEYAITNGGLTVGGDGVVQGKIILIGDMSLWHGTINAPSITANGRISIGQGA